MEYKKYLQSTDWKAKRKKKTSRSTNKRCGICASTYQLDVHHLNYKNLYDVENTDLRVLCRDCHFLAHKLHKEGKYKFTSTNHHSRFALIKSAVKKELGISSINMFAP